jgi:hypothetical protein
MTPRSERRLVSSVGSQSCVGAVMRVVSVVSAGALAILLGGCAIVADPNAWPQKFNYADSTTMASGAGVRFVNVRHREMPGGPPLSTMCSEPSPDAAIAFGTALSAQATINGQGSGTGSASTSEGALALAGRTAGILALRDGLYATCQAYTNGALGQSAYALGLSQYGNLLVAITAHDADSAGGNSVTNSSASPGAASAGGQASNPLNPALFAPTDSARAALMVACISEYDPTRIGAVDPKTGQPVNNPVLDRNFCVKYLKELSAY